MSDPSATVILACGGCGQKMKVPAKAAGKTIACVKCGEKITVPQSGAPAAQSSAAPPASGSAPAPPPKSTASRSGKPVNPDAQDADRVVQMLLRYGLTTPEAVAETRLVQQDIARNTWELLIDFGHVDPEAFHRLMAQEDGVAILDLQNYSIPPDVSQFVPEALVRKHMVFPVDKLGKLLTVAMPCPADVEAQAAVQEATGLKIKVMLCALEDLRGIVREYYPDEREAPSYDDAFGKELAKEFGEIIDRNPFAARIFDLGPVPIAETTMKRLESAVADPNGSLAELTQIVASDPLAVARVLAVANSAAYGFAKRVDNIELAVALVGRETLGQILRELGTVDYLAQEYPIDCRAAWRRAQFCSQAAKALAVAMDSQRVVTAQTAAILHELGRFGLMAAAPRSYPAVSRGQGGPGLAEVEERIYHLSHAEAGYLMARVWNLPPGITEPLRYRFAPQDATKMREVAGLVAIAAAMTDAHGSGGQDYLTGLEPILEQLGLTADQCAAAFREATAAMAA